MNCPQCGSENTQKFSIIYEHGSHDVTSTSTTSITPTFSFFESASAKTTTAGTSLTKAAQKTAPPAKATYPIAGSLIGFAIFLFLGAVGPFFYWTGIAIILLCGFITFKAFTFNSNVWPQRYELWLRRWMCNKCGNVYQE